MKSELHQRYLDERKAQSILSPPPPVSSDDDDDGDDDDVKPSSAFADKAPQTPNNDNGNDNGNGLSAPDTAHLQATPASVMTNFSIADSDEGIITTPNGGDILMDDKLEVDYGNDDDVTDDDDDVVDDEDIEGTATFGLAQRTNQIMNSYKDYIAEIQSEHIGGGDAELAKVELDMENGNGSIYTSGGGGSMVDSAKGADMITGASLVSPSHPYSYNHQGGGGEILQTNNLRDVSVLGASEADFNINDATSYEDFYGDLGFHPTRKYRHPFLRSKKFKRAVSISVVTILLVGLIAGLGNAMIRPKSGSQEDGNSPIDESGSSNNDITIETTDQSGGDPSVESGSSEMDRPFEPYDPNSTPDVSNALLASRYKQMFETFQPKWYDRTSGWRGQTYEDARMFCAEQDSSIVCPDEALCPLGPHNLPSGGVQEEVMDDGSGRTIEQWAPVVDEENLWVRVSLESSGIENVCVQNKDPVWGLTGENNEGNTRHIMCCRSPPESAIKDDGAASSSAADDSKNSVEEDEMSYEDQLVQSAMYKYQPQEYSRKTGWEGQTYLEAVHFCGSIQGSDGNEEERSVCPYAAICPMGHDTQPLGDYSDANDGKDHITWIPISDRGNDWVRVSNGSSGSAGVCLNWMAENPEPPEWGITGEGSEYFTRYIMCCFVPEDELGSSAASDGSVSSSVGTYQGAGPNVAEGFDANYPDVTSEYKPTTFTRTTGWTGSKWVDALGFCGEKSMIVCPYVAICPKGIDTRPYGGTRMNNAVEGGDNEVWAPLMDPLNLNAWVQIGPENTCVKHSEMYITPPQWGLQGNSDSDVTPYLMCCELNEEDQVVGTSAAGGVSTSSQGGSNPVDMIKPVQASTTQATALMMVNAVESAPAPVPPITTTADSLKPFQLVASKYKPIIYDRSSEWTGRTYDDATSFCALRGMLCPFEAYCPMGPQNKPYMGFIDEPNGNWAPIGNDYNWWISITTESPCLFYNVINMEPPKWGLSGEDSEEITRHIMCCIEEEVSSVIGNIVVPLDVFNAEGDAVTLSSPLPTKAEMYQDIYRPTRFSRSEGWGGNTWPEALDFCAELEGMEMCPFDVVCPDGDGSAPLGGPFDDEPNGSWAPIVDSFNDWVRVSSDNQCIRYKTKYGDGPDWGVTGDEVVTRHIVCCNAVGADSLNAATFTPPQYVTADADTATADSGNDDGAIIVATVPSLEEYEGKPFNGIPPEVILQMKYDPKWFHRTTGWTGSTYSSAVDFCSSEHRMTLCPFEVYCPGGYNGPVLGGESGVFNEEPDGSWAPVIDKFNEWVRISSANECTRWGGRFPEPPEWGGVGGAGNEDVTKHLMCCAPQETDGAATTEATTTTASTTTTTMTPPATTQTAFPFAGASASVLVGQTLQEAEDKYIAKWYTRSTGWVGQTYTEALMFCAERSSNVPCPFEAYCPQGPGEHVLGGIKAEHTWAPMIDVPNGWVAIGPENTCMTYNAYNPVPPEWGLSGDGNEEVTRHIMCCHEPEDGIGMHLQDEPSYAVDEFDIDAERTDTEQSVMDLYHPVWYGTRHGYKGTTHEDAQQFCENIGGKKLCPWEAYCPNGLPKVTTHKALFLDRPSFGGEQWAPFASSKGSGGVGGDTEWVMIGTVNQNPTSTCGNFDELSGIATWQQSGQPSKHKEHVLCCSDEDKVDAVETLEEIIMASAKPAWYSVDKGWNGGSYQEAKTFCNDQGNRELCTYTQYCPYGSGKSVMGGHKEDFDDQGEQWAPIGEMENDWVMIGQKYENSATTCMTFKWLEGGSPVEWETKDEVTELKRHIMCCMPMGG